MKEAWLPVVKRGDVESQKSSRPALSVIKIVGQFVEWQNGREIKQLCVRTTLSAHRSEGFANFGQKFVFNDCGNIKLKLLAYRRLRQGWQAVYPGRTVYINLYMLVEATPGRKWPGRSKHVER